LHFTLYMERWLISLEKKQIIIIPISLGKLVPENKRQVINYKNYLQPGKVSVEGVKQTFRRMIY